MSESNDKKEAAATVMRKLYRSLQLRSYQISRPPPPSYVASATAGEGDDADIIDGAPDIFPHSHAYHVPLFILTVSLVEIIVFTYHTIDLSQNHGEVVTSSGPVPYCSALIYSPYRRYEVS